MKSIEKLTFTDDYMFGQVMKNMKICKGVIERLLPIKVEKVELITLQKDISPCYETKTVFKNHPEKIFDDNTHRIFYNASAYKKESDPELYAFLQFVSTNVPEDNFTDEIFDLVEKNKIDEKFRSEYMRCNIHDYDIMEDGIAIGEKRAKIEAARNMLLEGVPMDKIATWQALPLETVRELAEHLQVAAK